MILGTLGSTGNGLRFPIMTILVDAFGENQTDSNVADKVSFKFVWLWNRYFCRCFSPSLWVRRNLIGRENFWVLDPTNRGSWIWRAIGDRFRSVNEKLTAI
ncbi:ABC transporter B family member 4 [Raphanus sativus]|uniref:ABC transporter B family member 4 n=1 Tax=Raphanus sativus TaxID=3726 RepID=A0A6J0JZH1_RAPSA|nr:ABC transporter B family member 4 [Raphanus sativus]